MPTKRFTEILSALLGVIVFLSEASAGSFILENQIGWLQGNCLAINNEHLRAGTKIVLVSLAGSPKVSLAEVRQKTDNAGTCAALKADRRDINIQNVKGFYDITSKSPIDLAIGIVVKNKKIRRLDAYLDVNGDGRKDTFDSCYTSEGIQFTIWDGDASKSKKLWTDYYYLGYDMEPTCPPP
jgi:hypothetical protein